MRKSGQAELGWIELSPEDYSYRFPGIVHPASNARGYTVYTVHDWRAPESSFGDLSDSYDWAYLTCCGGGTGAKFTATGAKASLNGIDIRGFRLPVTAEQWDRLAADFGPERVQANVGYKPGVDRRHLVDAVP